MRGFVMWVFVFFLACVALSLLVHYLKTTPKKKEPKDSRGQNPISKQQLDQSATTKLTHDTEIEEPIELIRAMTQFSLMVTPRPKSMGDAAMMDVDGQVNVSVEHQTCTCKKFADRADRPMNNIGRWCRHLVVIMRERGAVDHENEWIKAIIEDGYDGPLYAFMVDRPTTGQILMTGKANSEWLNFYARDKRRNETVAQASGKIKRYGWSLKRKGWAYGNPPPGAREIRALIQSVDRINIEK